MKRIKIKNQLILICLIVMSNRKMKFQSASLKTINQFNNQILVVFHQFQKINLNLKEVHQIFMINFLLSKRHKPSKEHFRMNNKIKIKKYSHKKIKIFTSKINNLNLWIKLTISKDKKLYNLNKSNNCIINNWKSQSHKRDMKHMFKLRKWCRKK